jgi:type IV fimbrial biogenesis protein FimT
MKNQLTGFTLIELIITIAIASILFGTALPNFSEFLDRRKVTSNLHSLAEVIQLSRSTAVNENRRVTLCPTSDGETCNNIWSEGFLSFIDIDGDRAFDPEDTQLYVSITHDEKLAIKWRAFGRRSSLQWLETGITNHQNGSFELCYDNNPKHARALILTKAGRMRYSKDTNNDQLHENSTGEPINC